MSRVIAVPRKPLHAFIVLVVVFVLPVGAHVVRAGGTYEEHRIGD